MTPNETETPSRAPDAPSDRRDGIRITGRQVTAVIATLAVLKVGWEARGAFSSIQENQRIMDVRLCRIEVANHITPWPTCGARPAEAQTATVSQ